MEFLFVTGMSGAGKSNAANALEDLGYYCVDNIPPILINSFVDLAKKGDLKLSKVAIVTDCRGGEGFNNINEIFDSFSREGITFKILFLDASDAELARRYSETRRKHPLCDTYNLSIHDAIAKERELLLGVRARANFVIDTTRITAGQLKKRLSALFLEKGKSGLNIICMSFGYKYGPLNEGNLVFDVRCLPNPFYIDELRPLTGLDKAVSDYVMKFETSQKLSKYILDLVLYSIPLYIEEGKSELVIAFGCTGGKHRSVTFTEELYKALLKKGYKVNVSHRDIDKR